jgi:hypothetical protein
MGATDRADQGAEAQSMLNGEMPGELKRWVATKGG